MFAIAFFIAALVANNDVLKRASLTLFVICSIFGVPTYVAGTAAMWALTQPADPRHQISKAVINAHRDMALWTLFGLAFTGGARLDRAVAVALSRSAFPNCRSTWFCCLPLSPSAS